MGIRFWCPNGHKLHVKDFLAGKRGICPECGVKLMIPLESQAAGTRVAELTSDEEVAEAPVAPFPSSVAEPVVAVDRSPEWDALPPDVQQLLRERLDAIWYVRSPEAEPQGPIANAVMGAWYRDGRLTADGLVWRDDWPEWRSVAEVFRLPSPASTVAPVIAVTPVSVQVSTARPSTTTLQLRRRQSQRWSAQLVAFLSVVCLCLLGALIVVVLRNRGIVLR